jgi:hypothetical protein
MKGKLGRYLDLDEHLARPNSSRLRSCARLPDEDLVLIGDLFSQSASRRSTTRTAANWILPDGWGG